MLQENGGQRPIVRKKTWLKFSKAEGSVKAILVTKMGGGNF